MKKLIAVLFVLVFTVCACSPVTTEYSSTVESDYVYDTTYIAPDDVASKSPAKKPNVSSSKTSKTSSQKQTNSNKTSSKSDKNEPDWLSTGNKPQFETYIPSGTVTYACYEALNATQKQIYNKIDNAVNQMTEGMIALGECSEQDMQIALYAVRMDRPEYFWMPTTYVTDVINNAQRVIAFSYQSGENSVSYTCTKQERTAMENKLKAKIEEIKKLVPKDASAYDIELVLHDYVCKNVTYDDSKKRENNLTAYGALVDGFAVCEGYSRAMQLLLNQFSIPCRLVCGYAGEEHMWNLVKIGGKWHHLDATWDDLNKSGNEIITMHYYFNISDDRIKDTHRMDIDFKKADSNAIKNGSFNLSIPECKSLEYFYGNVENIVLNDDIEKSMNVIKRVLYEAASKNESTCEVYIDSSETKWEIVQNKYHLPECITEVNKLLSKKIKISRVVFDHKTGRSLIFVIEYLK